MVPWGLVNCIQGLPGSNTTLNKFHSESIAKFRVTNITWWTIRGLYFRGVMVPANIVKILPPHFFTFTVLQCAMYGEQAAHVDQLSELLQTQQVAIGRRVGQVFFQPQRSSHFRLKHDVGATLTSVSGLFVFSVTSRLSVFTALPRRNDRSNAQASGVRESSALRFASYF